MTDLGTGVGLSVEQTLLGERPQQDDLEAQRIRSIAWARLAGETAAPTTIDRYEILGLAGSGGMGVVYRAFDPRLGRVVAVKVLRLDRRRSDIAALPRLRAEAQTLARLDDARIVPIFDIGEAGGELFIVMAFVEGVDLDHWLASPRTPGEILAVFLEAAAGLGAAHRAGVVHRDFKPSNVIVEPSGAVRVVDFGLARLANEVDTLASTPSSPGSSGGSPRLTQTGAVVGTPTYMAPEQERGESVDGRADQYAFCIALTHALPQSARAGALGDALARGLSPAAADRWPSMAALVHALSVKPRRVGFKAALAFAGLALVASQLGAPADACPDAVALSDAWTSARATAVAQAFAGQGRLGTEAWDRVQPRLDTFAADYGAAATQACAAGADPRAVPCLVRTRARLHATVGALERVDGEAVVGAVDAVAALIDPARCLTEPGDAHVDPTVRDEVARVRAALEAGAAALELARLEPAWEHAQRSVYAAEALSFASLLLDAQLLMGKVELARDESSNARASFGQAYSLAHELHDDTAAVEAALGIATAFERARDPEPSLRWIRHAEAALVRAGDPPDLARELAARRGRALSLAERHEEAHAWFERALELAEAADPNDPGIGLFMSALAGAESKLGRRAAAEALLRPALRRVEDAWGPNHPHVAGVCSTLAAVIGLGGGKIEEAIALGERALSIVQLAYGPHSPRVIPVAHNLSRAYMLVDREQEAETLLRQAVAAARVEAGNGPLRTAEPLVLLASLVARDGRDEEAAALSREVIAAAEHRHQVEAEAWGRMQLAASLLRMGQSEPAVAEGRRAVERITAALGPDHPKTLVQRAEVAQLLRRADQYAAAIDLADETRAAVVRSRSPDPLLEVRLLGLTALAFTELEQPGPARKRFAGAVDRLLAAPAGGARPRVACELIRFGRHVEGAQLDALRPLCPSERPEP